MLSKKEKGSREDLLKLVKTKIEVDNKKEKKKIEEKKRFLNLLLSNEEKYIKEYNELLEELEAVKDELAEIYEEIDNSEDAIQEQKNKYNALKREINVIKLWYPQQYEEMKKRFSSLKDLDKQIEFMLNKQEIKEEKEANDNLLLEEGNPFKTLENNIEDINQHIIELEGTKRDKKNEKNKYKNIKNKIKNLLNFRNSNYKKIIKMKEEIKIDDKYESDISSLLERLRASSPVNNTGIKRGSPHIFEDEKTKKKTKGGRRRTKKNKKTKTKYCKKCNHCHDLNKKCKKVCKTKKNRK
tara:strand:+ start:804 stop:1694 length:891 start_codon:yes stop_codon:yes gene_type:complete